MVGFKASARLLDDGIGVVLDALQASVKAEETLVIYTTDHGIALPGMKCSLIDHGIWSYANHAWTWCISRGKCVRRHGITNRSISNIV